MTEDEEAFIQQGIDKMAGLFFWIRHSLDMTKTSPEFRSAWRGVEVWYFAAKSVRCGAPVASALRSAMKSNGEDFATREGHLEVFYGDPRGRLELISTTKPIVEIRDGELRPVVKP